MCLDIKILKFATSGIGVVSVLTGLLWFGLEICDKFGPNFITKFLIILFISIHEVNSIGLFVGVLLVSTFMVKHVTYKR